MKIKLILAASKTDPLRRNDPFMPLSLPLLAATVPDHDYTFVDMLWEDDPGYGDNVDLVGISVRYTAENRAYEIADEFRRRGIRVVLGGAQISSVPHRAVAHADVVVVGEGEPLWPRVLQDAASNTLKTFYVCSPEPFDSRGHELYQINNYPELSEIPRIPSKFRKLYRGRYTFDTVFAVRGCCIGCDFCAVPRIFGRKFRTRPLDDVAAEIDSIKGYYYLLDDSVFGKPATYDYYLNLYDRISRQRRVKFWIGQGNLDAAADSKGREVIRRAVEAGLIYAAIGIESINESTLRGSGAMAKVGASRERPALEQIKENIRFIQDLGVIVSGWFVVGYDGDNEETYYQTLEFCREMNIIPAIFPVKALPGTELYERLEKEGKLDDSRLLNYRNPKISDNAVLKALAHIYHTAYSTPAILRRSAFYAPKFRRNRIESTIFGTVLQYKLKSGLDIRNDEFYRGKN